jgi:hypothetical protein
MAAFAIEEIPTPIHITTVEVGLSATVILSTIPQMINARPYIYIIDKVLFLLWT